MDDFVIEKIIKSLNDDFYIITIYQRDRWTVNKHSTIVRSNSIDDVLNKFIDSKENIVYIEYLISITFAYFGHIQHDLRKITTKLYNKLSQSTESTEATIKFIQDNHKDIKTMLQKLNERGMILLDPFSPVFNIIKVNVGQWISNKT